MPHQCTNCAEIYTDGSEQILDGCAGCGGKKFQFLSEKESAQSEFSQQGSEDEAGDPAQQTVQTQSRVPPGEDKAQHAARSEVPETLWDHPEPVADDLSEPDNHPPSDTDGDDDIIVAKDDAEGSEGDETDDGSVTQSDIPFSNVDQLREQLNDQFGSIKVRAPGEYSLNLMELYENTEYVITLETDGQYVIESVGSWNPESRAR